MYMRGGQRVGQGRREAAPYGYPLLGGHGVSLYHIDKKSPCNAIMFLIYNTIFIYPFLHTKAEAL